MSGVAAELLLVLVMMGTLPVGAEEPALTQPQELEGRILAVDAQRRMLTLEPLAGPSREPFVLAFTEQTVVTRAGARLWLDDLKASRDPVVVLQDAHEGVPMVIAVTYEKPDGLRRAAGMIDRISLGEGLLHVAAEQLLGSGATHEFRITEDTLVIHEGQRRYAAVLQPGDEVTVESAESGSAEELPLAHTITVTAMVQGSPWSPWGWWRMTPQAAQRPTTSPGGSPMAR